MILELLGTRFSLDVNHRGLVVITVASPQYNPYPDPSVPADQFGRPTEYQIRASDTRVLAAALLEIAKEADLHG